MPDYLRANATKPFCQTEPLINRNMGTPSYRKRISVATSSGSVLERDVAVCLLETPDIGESERGPIKANNPLMRNVW